MACIVSRLWPSPYFLSRGPQPTCKRTCLLFSHHHGAFKAVSDVGNIGKPLHVDGNVVEREEKSWEIRIMFEEKSWEIRIMLEQKSWEIRIMFGESVWLGQLSTPVWLCQCVFQTWEEENGDDSDGPKVHSHLQCITFIERGSDGKIDYHYHYVRNY